MKTIVIIIFLLTFSLYSIGQVDVSYTKVDCSTKIIKTKGDTIIAIGNPICSDHLLDTTKNGLWIIYSKDSIILDRVKLENCKKNGMETIRWLDYSCNCYYTLTRNYINGKINGAVILYYSNGQIASFSNYKDNRTKFIYFYNEVGQLTKIKYYNKKGMLTKCKTIE